MMLVLICFLLWQLLSYVCSCTCIVTDFDVIVASFIEHFSIHLAVSYLLGLGKYRACTYLLPSHAGHAVNVSQWCLIRMSRVQELPADAAILLSSGSLVYTLIFAYCCLRGFLLL